MSFKLDIGLVSDINLKDLFQYIQREADTNPLFGRGMSIKEYAFNGAVTDAKVSHGLGFRPTDAIITYKSGTTTVSLNYDNFDETNIVITTSGATRVRILLGRL